MEEIYNNIASTVGKSRCAVEGSIRTAIKSANHDLSAWKNYDCLTTREFITTIIADVRRVPMSNIKRIIKLNRNRQRAIREKDFRKFYTFSCKIHLIERMDKVPIGSYILK